MMDAGSTSNVLDFTAAYQAARESRRALVAEERRQKQAQRPRRRRQPPEGLDDEGLRRWRMKEDLRIDDARKFAEQRR